MQFLKLIFLLAIGITLCYAKVESGSDGNSVNSLEKSNSTIADKQSTGTLVQSSLFPTDLTWKAGFGQALIIVGATAFSFVLVGGLTLLFAPLFGYKICSILGNCEPIVTPYSSGSTLQSSAQPNSYSDSYGAYYATAPYAAYKKRSLEYVKPILESLAAAYERK